MSVTQLELRCSNSTVHYVLDNEDLKDPLLNSNELKQRVKLAVGIVQRLQRAEARWPSGVLLFSMTPKFILIPSRIRMKNVEKVYDLFGYRLIKTFKSS